MRRSHVFGVVGLLLGLAAGILLGTTVFDDDDGPQVVQLAPGVTASGQAADAVPAVVKVDVAGRPTRGPGDAKVTVVEFTDFQCPFCGQYFRDTLPKVRERYGSRIRYVVREFPLENIHPHARKAAEAAECAHDQGGFWEYHDVLFEHQHALGTGDLKRYAREVGLDGGRFDRCLDSLSKNDAVEKDVLDGQRYGVTGTPTFFINGERMAGALTYDAMKAAIERKLGG